MAFGANKSISQYSHLIFKGNFNYRKIEMPEL